MTRAALYARVSTTQHGQDVGLQLDELRQVAVQRGWTVADTYVDDGRSGADRHRPALARMLEDARRGRLDVVAVWKLDRLARDMAHLLEVAGLLETSGVDLCAVRDAAVDTTTPTGRFSLQILGSVAELERSLVKERVVAGLERARQRGVKLGRPRTQVDMRPVYAMLRTGHSLRATAEALGISRRTLTRRLALEPMPPADG
jgi:DNA invertase Pin-like site-specific DNA recombinase